MVDYYEILQVSPHAEPEIIEAAYKRLALKYHPDTNPTPSATTQMKWINEAYAILSDPAQRANYDDERRAYRSNAAPRAEAPAPAPTPANPKPIPRSRPKLRRLRACTSLLLVLAVAAAAMWALQQYNMFRISDYIPPISLDSVPNLRLDFLYPPTPTPVPPAAD